MSNRIPKYRKHASGQARVTLGGKTIYLGQHGSPESRQLYKTVVQDWLAKTGRFAPAGSASLVLHGPTVNEVALGYLEHAEEYYQTNPKEIEKVALSIRPLRKLHGRTSAATFDTVALESVQAALVASNLARTTVNERIRVIKRLFKWGVRKKMVPASVFGELLTVDGLKRGRSKARETDPVRPVPNEHIEAVLGKVNRHVAALIRLQLLTGARPGELLILRRSDIEIVDPVWVFRPARHKNLWRGKEREIYFGPQGQAIVRAFFRPNLDGFLFSPRIAREERFAELRANRKTKVQPSQLSRKKLSPKKSPGERYTTYSYRRAIARACIDAGVPAWHPHQLRHNAGTLLRKQYGIDTARVILGHTSAATTLIYAEADVAKAVAAMSAAG